MYYPDGDGWPAKAGLSRNLRFCSNWQLPMCVNYTPIDRAQLGILFDAPGSGLPLYPSETWQDYLAPIIRSPTGKPEAAIASFGMIPKGHLPVGKRYTTMNARAETVASLRTYAPAWRGFQFCLVPMTGFFEPCYESGKAERWHIGMADGSPFAVAGLWRTWKEDHDVETSSFTLLTVNADAHPVLSRFHKPEDEKRSLVVVRPERYQEWLTCRSHEQALTFLSLLNQDAYSTKAAPKPPRGATKAPNSPSNS